MPNRPSPLVRPALAALLLATALRAEGSASVVVSQVYGGGGATSGTPTYKYDYVELFNPTFTSVSIAGWSLQYGSSTGNFASTSSNLYTFAGGTSIPPGSYLLVRVAPAGTVGAELPVTPDVSTTNLTMSAASGKVALVNTGVALGCGATATPCALPDARIVDLVAYGVSNNGEGGTSVNAGTAMSSTLGGVRKADGCTDTDSNSADFDAVSGPVPRNSGSPTNPCTTSVVSVAPATLFFAQPLAGAAPPSQAVTVTNAGSGTLTFTAATGGEPWLSVAPGSGTAPQSLTVSASAGALPSGYYNGSITVTNSGNPTDVKTVSVTLHVSTPIPTIQGSALQSGYVGQPASVVGTVTGVMATGFFLQDPAGDGNDATSDGLFVVKSSAGVAVGDSVIASGTVAEYRPGGRPNDQKTTELAGGVTLRVLGAGAVPPAVIVTTDPGRTGPGIRHIPSAIDTSASFDPANDALDFWESLEGMRVQVDSAVAVGPMVIDAFPVLADFGVGATGVCSRGEILTSPGDSNGERILITDGLVGVTTPAVAVGDRATAPIVGVLDYEFSSYVLRASASPAMSTALRVTPDAPLGGTTPTQLRVATFVTRYLTAGPAGIAGLISRAGYPDVAILTEIPDDSGSTNDGTVSSEATLTGLASAVSAGGGPAYSWAYVTPVDNQDGGSPGTNGRPVVFFRTDRGLSPVLNPAPDATTANSVLPDGSLLYSPGRIAPTDIAWNVVRKPLTVQFAFQGRRVVVVALHLLSPGADTPIYGETQPPNLVSATQRLAGASLVRSFVTDLLTQDSSTLVIVAGQIWEETFGPTPMELETDAPPVAPQLQLRNAVLVPSPGSCAFAYLFNGNALAMDHIYLPLSALPRLLPTAFLHATAEWPSSDPAYVTDHDPFVAVIDFSPSIPTDSDFDGTPDSADCAPGNPNVWAKPTEARALAMQDDLLTWAPPLTAGGVPTEVVYDVLRSFVPQDWNSAVCVAAGQPGTAALDPFVSPGGITYYLVRARNACGGPLGSDSAGTPTVGRSCP
jgi:uncharacterized protein